MTLQIKLSPEAESQLEREAARHGLDVGEYARVLIEQNLSTPSSGGPSLWRSLSPEEWVREFEAWTESHRDLPVLPPEAYERASFYGGHDQAVCPGSSWRPSRARGM